MDINSLPKDMIKHIFPLTAKQVRDYLNDLESRGENLDEITINYRHDYDSDIVQCFHVFEDLYDNEDNNSLMSIVFVTDDEEK